jgi:cytochrome c oxidase cbb3-type subunit 1/cytochrome c oxidase cbb3-type subunit I/II
MMALPIVQRVTHFNNWVVGHAHIGVLGFAAMTALGGLYYVLPRICGKPIYSRFLVDLQYWLILIGISGMAIVLTIVGLIQGNAWLNGETVYRVLPEIHIYYVLRVATGLLIAGGAYIGLYNILRTLFFNPGAKA